MATLASQLATDFALLVPDTHYESAALTRASVLAASTLIRYGANDSDTDTEACALGLDYLCWLVLKRYAMVSDETAISDGKRLMEELADFRASRQQEASTPVVYDADGELVDGDS